MKQKPQTEQSNVTVKGREFTVRGKLASRIANHSRRIGVPVGETANMLLALGMLKLMIEKGGASADVLNGFADTVVLSAFRAGAASR